MNRVFFALSVGTRSDRIVVYRRIRDDYTEYHEGDYLVLKINHTMSQRIRIRINNRERRSDLEKEGLMVWTIYCQTLDQYCNQAEALSIANALVSSGGWHHEEDFKRENPSFF